jgi:hypothetical protein
VRFWLLGLIFTCCGLASVAQQAEPAPAVAPPVEEGAANDKGLFRAGAAKIDITPALGAPLNGYGDRQGRGATSVHDPLWARCLCLDDGKTRVFLVNADLCLITPELRAAVLELLPPGVPRENVILTATHTHNGPGGMSRPVVFRLVSGRYMPELVQETAQKFSQVMRAAVDACKPATVGYGTGEQTNLSVNRRHADGPTDPQIGVIRVDDAQKHPIAVVTNFAAHPTSVPDEDHYAYSADYPGFYYKELESLEGEGCVALFINGAEGNQTCSTPERVDGWERTESVGRLLAARAKEIADGITTRDVKLHLGYATPTLPQTLASSIVPTTTVLHTLEIDDLLMTFVPGEPCVEIGLELRRRAIQRGYAAQFTVGLSNDYLGYFVPQACYGHFEYEAAMNFYGPRMTEFFGDEFGKLMTRAGEKEAPKSAPAPAEVGTLAGARSLVLAGSPYDMGYARGAAFAEDIQKIWKEKVLAPVENRSAVPKDFGLWQYAPTFMDLTPLALPRLAIGARPFLGNVSPDLFGELEGMADGAKLPFDAMLLVQCAPALAEAQNIPELYRAPFCTMFAVVGDQAGSGGLIVGRNLDWTGDDAPVIVDCRPENGRRFFEIGFPWNAGVFTGMNETGLVLCAERLKTKEAAKISGDGAPIEFVLRDILQTTEDLKTALELLRKASYLRGYRVLVATAYDTEARVVEYGNGVSVRDVQKGVLLGVRADDDSVDDATRQRYARVAELVGKDAVDVSKAGLVLHDSSAAGDAAIDNEHTRHSVIFEPMMKRLRVAFPQEDGTLGEYTTLSFSKGAK